MIVSPVILAMGDEVLMVAIPGNQSMMMPIAETSTKSKNRTLPQRTQKNITPKKPKNENRPKTS